MPLVVVVDNEAVSTLRAAVSECNRRGLIASAKWSSELLVAIDPSRRIDSHFDVPSDQSPATLVSEDLDLALRDGREGEQLLMAERHVECRQYRQAIHVLQSCVSERALFLRVYSRFICNEQKALKEWHLLDNNRHQPPVPVNVSLTDLLQEVEIGKDSWLLFLQSMFLSRLSRIDEAIDRALQSIFLCPWNWAAWQVLGCCIDSENQLETILSRLALSSSHPAVFLFRLQIASELHSSNPILLEICDALLAPQCFPNSLWIKGLRARILYDLLDFARAEAQFEHNLEADPYRMDEIDVYSNLLYTTANKTKLSRLAQTYLHLDNSRPEVCCMVGNHYSIRKEHEKAIRYFRRAAHLDRTCLQAWVLMGHEYSEMQNHHAAIESYRRACPDVNKKDYRGWYGLGSNYHRLNLWHHAIYYIQRASVLRPTDVSIWQALGHIFWDMSKPHETIDSYTRSLTLNPSDLQGIEAHVKMAKAHQELGNTSEAIFHHKQAIKIFESNETASLSMSETYHICLLEVAQDEAGMDADLALSMEYAERILGSSNNEMIRGAASDALKMFKARAEVQKMMQLER